MYTNHLWTDYNNCASYSLHIERSINRTNQSVKIKWKSSENQLIIINKLINKLIIAKKKCIKYILRIFFYLLYKLFYVYFTRDCYGSIRVFTWIDGTASTRLIERAGCAILNYSRLNFVHDVKLSEKCIE